MTKKVTSSSSSGIGFFGLLAIVFIVLKLTGFIDWAWIWVLSPIWGGCILSVIAIVFFVGLAYIVDKL